MATGELPPIDRVAAFLSLAGPLDLLFFAIYDDSALDPDIAVQEIENIAASLDMLDETQRTTVVQILKQIASETIDNSLKMEILNTPQSLGWMNEDG